MEPTDQPPPTPQTWAETSAWATPPQPSHGSDEPPEPAKWKPVPGPIHQPPLVDDYVRPTVGAVPGSPRTLGRGWSATRWMVFWALLAELVIIAAGCNQWVSKKVLAHTGLVPEGLRHQIIFSTQTFGWRLTKARGEHTDAWLSSFVLIGAVLVITALLVMVVARSGSFWRAGIVTVLIVVFATQVSSVLSGLVYSHPGVAGVGVDAEFGFQAVDQTGVYGPTPTLGSGGSALFGATGPTAYRFVAGVILGVLVGIVVGIAARRLGDDDAEPAGPLWPSQQFFPPGQMQRTYEASTSTPPLAAPGSFAPSTDDELGGGRHSRD